MSTRRTIRASKRRERTIKRIGQTFFLPASLFYMELLAVSNTAGFLENGGRGWSILYIFLFTFSLGFLLNGIAALFRGAAKHIVTAVLLALLTVACGTQIVYFHIFKTYTVLSAVLMAGMVLGDENFGAQAAKGIGECVVPILLLLIPLLLFALFHRRIQPERAHKGRNFFRGVLYCGVLHLLAMLLVALNTKGLTSFHYVYYDDFTPTLSVPRFGVITTMRLDMKALMFPKSGGSSGTGNRPVTNVTPTWPKGPRKPELPNLPAAATQDPVAPVVYEPRVLEIDFDALIAGESNKTIKDMHQYFASVEPTLENQYTGLFKGKNLIWIVGEAFSRYCVSETYTPTLYKLSHEGFVFENFYNPVWYASTSDGEYTTLTGLIPKNGVRSFKQSSNNWMAFSFGHLMGDLGYKTLAYHNHTWNYYNRDMSHPNMGYDYKGNGHGLTMTKSWPESDLEMMEKTVDEYIGTGEPFHVYYLTVSGHMEYNFPGNNMAKKHKADVKPMLDAGYSENAAAYVACNMELDLAMEYLLNALEEAGILDDTVIVLSGDHYPYGMSLEQIEELYGGELDQDFEMTHSTLIIWNSQMKRPVTVEKVCSSIDIMPTLANLFDLPVDSRLVMGRDILSTAPGLVVFENKSFITDYGRYSARLNQFTPNEGVELPDTYARDIMQIVRDRFSYSAKILDNDYYAKVFGKS